jgi:hypothetical protein
MPNEGAGLVQAETMGSDRAGKLALDPLERLERWVKVKTGEIPDFSTPGEWGDVLHEDLVAGVAEIKRLRGCPAAKNGQHLWAMFPVGPDGNKLYSMSSAVGQAGCFCQHCGVRQPVKTKETTNA